MSTKSQPDHTPDTHPGEPLLLTEGPSEPEADVPQLLQTGGPAVKLEDLGPMVVNTDGTLSRISNWSNLTDPEKERTLRVLSARNKFVFDFHIGFVF
ncbi:hypothetical protein B0H17DRAFT_942428 [Mycena rosella]|uniref:Uncharacterized protein n=1 Tax=Mycena rosella TaxID=1033263 RepID=A0AAD7D6V9_MYCRO|nr:hypothetical protein B0H17DRAFT_942428 [Mycena rosella]